MAVGGMEVGSAFVTIVPSFRGFGTALKREMGASTRGVGQDIGERIGRDITGGISRAGAGISRVGGSLTKGLTLPIVGLGAAVTKSALTFNKGMANIATLIPGNTKRVEQLKNAILNLAPAVGKSTGDLTDGLYQVISAFGDTADSVNILRTNAKAATAGLASTQDAINLTSAVTKGYGDTSAKAVKQAADLALMTVRLGQTTFPELAASVGKVIPLSQNLAVSQEEVFATMSAFTGVTGNAAEVSTQMRGALQSLLSPTAAAAKAMKQAGYESGAALVKQKGFAGAVGFLTDAATKSGQPLANFIGSIEGQTIALGLAGAQSKDYNKKLAAMADAGGTTSEAFDAMTKGVGKQAFEFEQLKAQAQTTAIRLGDALAPALGDALTAARPLIKSVTDLAKRFQNASPETQRMVVKLAAIAAIAGPVLIVTGKLVTAIGRTAGAAATFGRVANRHMLTPLRAMATGFAQPASGASAFASRSQRLGAVLRTGLGKGLAATSRGLGIATKAVFAFTASLLTNPVFLIIAGIIALGVAIYLAYRRFESVRKVVDVVGAAFKAVGQAIVGGALAAFHGLRKAVGALGPVFNALTQPLRGFLNIVQGVGTVLVGVFTGDMDKVKAGARQALGGIVQYFTALPLKVLGALSGLADNLIGFFRSIPLVDAITQPLQGIVQALHGFVDIVVGIFTGDFSRVSKGIAGVLGGIVRIFLGLPARIVIALVRLGPTLARAGVGGMKSMARGTVSGAVALFKFYRALPGRVFGLVTRLVKGLAGIAVRALRAMASGSKSGAVALYRFHRDLPGHLIDFVKYLVPKALALLKRAGEAMYRGIVSGSRALFTFVKRLPGRVLHGLGDLSKLLVSAGKDIIRGLISGVKSMAGAALKAVKNIAHDAVGAVGGALGIGSPSRVFRTIGEQTVQGFVDGLVNRRREVASTARTLARTAADTFAKAQRPLEVAAVTARRATAPDAGTVPDLGVRNERDLMRKVASLRPRVAAGAAAMREDRRTGGVVNVTVHNPRPEPAKQSVANALRDLTWSYGLTVV